MDACLTFIGFTDAAQRNRIIAESLPDFESMRYLTEKDVMSIADDYKSRTAAQGRIIFGHVRTKKLKALTHWVQDAFRCANPAPDVANISEDDLNDSYARAQGRKADADKEDHMAKAALPDKFSKEKEWVDFEVAFENYLSTIQGVYGVPLTYVIRENPVPPRNAVYPTFEEETVARAPLTGPVFQRDAKRVHQILLSLTVGGPGEEWMKVNAAQQNGRVDMQALKAHFTGAGNASRRIAEAERIKNNLHYKSERSMAFSVFLDRLQKMFNIYAKQGEPMSDSAKIRTLLNMCEGAPHISSAVAAMHVEHNQNRTNFTAVANHLQSMVSQHAARSGTSSRHISQVGSHPPQSEPSAAGKGRGRGCGRGGRGSRGGRGGRISTNFRSHAEWSRLSYAERDRIRSERTRKGERGGHKPGSDGAKRQIAELITQSKEMLATARELAAATTQHDDTTEHTTDEADTAAGDSFGGKREAKRTKKD